MLRSLFCAVLLTGSALGVTGLANDALAQTKRPQAPASTKYYVDVWEVKTSPQGRRSTTHVKTYTFRYRADATSERDYWNAIPHWYSGGSKHYYQARIR